MKKLEVTVHHPVTDLIVDFIVVNDYHTLGKRVEQLGIKYPGHDMTIKAAG